MVNHCNLAEAFPEYQENIRNLAETSNRFKHLADEYAKLDHELNHLETMVDSPDRDYIQRLKRLRLAVKEEVLYLLADAE